MVMIAEELVDTFATCTWRSRWWFGMLFFQTAKKSFGIRNTGLTTVEIVLLAFLGN